MNRTSLFSIILLISTQTTFSISCLREIASAAKYKAFRLEWIQAVNGKYTICDSNGCFEFGFCNGAEEEIITLSALEHNSDTLQLCRHNDTIPELLFPKEILLSEVSIVQSQTIKNTSMVSTISTEKKAIEMLNPQNISEVLQSHAGFTNRSGYQTPLTLRGLTGKRLLVLRNGLRRFSSYPAGYMSHTINVYDLEQIDVEKGPASVVYGSGAMAGIVNLIDRSLFEKKGISARFSTGYGSINHEKNILAGAGWNNGKLALRTNMRYRTAGNFEYADGTIAENSFFTDKDLHAALGYKISETQELTISSDLHNGGPWGKPLGFNGSDYMRVQTAQENSYNYSLQYKSKPGKVLQNLSINAYYANESRCLVKKYYTAAGYLLSYKETTNFSNHYYGAQAHQKIKVSNKFWIHAGGEFYGFHISTPTDAVDYIEGIAFQNRVSNNARSYLTGVYVENILFPSEKLKIVTGFRYDLAKVYEGDVFSNTQNTEMQANKHAISGNIATAWRVGASRLKLNAARSFRMPETTELYADSYTSNGILYANPDLEPEFCHSLDISYNIEKKNFDLEISPFIWLIDNMIAREEIKGMPGTNYQFINLDRSRIFGGEATAHAWIKSLVRKNDKLTFSFGAAYLNGSNIKTNSSFWQAGVPMDYVPPFNLKGNMTYNSPAANNMEFNLALKMVYYSEQKRLGRSKYATPAYALLGCSAGLSIKKLKAEPSLNITINNLFNTGYYSYLSYLQSEGRDIRIFLTINIG